MCDNFSPQFLALSQMSARAGEVSSKLTLSEDFESCRLRGPFFCERWYGFCPFAGADCCRCTPPQHFQRRSRLKWQ